MSLKKLLWFLDLFLPEQLFVGTEAPLVYRGRVIVATNLVSIVTAFALLVAISILHLSLFVFLGDLACILTLIGHLYFFRGQSKNFQKNLQMGATVQILVISIMVYLTSFSEMGMGFFGLIYAQGMV